MTRVILHTFGTVSVPSSGSGVKDATRLARFREAALANGSEEIKRQAEQAVKDTERRKEKLKRFGSYRIIVR